jgi:erythromycin esterase-like protein
VLIGQTTFTGEVTAARNWGEPAERKRVLPARADSHEAVLHAVPKPAFWLPTHSPIATDALGPSRLERAIGVIYRPSTERQSHYFDAVMASQFDAVVHWDVTHALEPLERSQHWDAGEPAETYPSGI